VRFSLDDDQEDLRRTVARLLEHTADTADVPPGDTDRVLWERLTGELGLAGLAVPVEHDGAGVGLVELAIVQEELGAALAPVPYLSSAVLAVSAFRLADDEAAAAHYLPELAKGVVAAVVLDAPARVERSGSRFLLHGHWPTVPDAVEAELLLVPGVGEHGASLFVLDAAAAGVTRSPAPELLDLTRPMAGLSLEGAEARPVGSEGTAGPVLERLRSVAAVALAAEQLGGARRCLESTTDYLGSRTAFGRPIGSFQALKHRCAGMFLEVEAARSAVYHAAWSAEHEDADFDLFAEATAAHCTETYCRVAGETIQMHGGIGFTWEHDLHFHLKRAVTGDLMFGGRAFHRARAAALMGLLPDAPEAA